MHAPDFSISSTLTRPHPKLPYAQIKHDVLGTSYSVSLVFIGPDRARTLNRTYRARDYVPNVLSFPLDAHHGEIFITPSVVAREARARSMSIRAYVGFLFIHGLLHLKGMSHGDTMERAEKTYLDRYSLA